MDRSPHYLEWSFGRRWHRDKFFKPIVVIYATIFGDNFMLMEDNCRPLRVNFVDDFLLEEEIVRKEWVAYSPYLNPTERVWWSWMMTCWPPITPTFSQGTENGYLKNWNKILQLLFNSFIDPSPQKCSKFLSFRRSNNHYKNILFQGNTLFIRFSSQAQIVHFLSFCTKLINYNILSAKHAPSHL